MAENTRTTRRRIEAVLREESLTLSALAAAVDRPPDVVADHVAHLARSLQHEEGTLLVAPPSCLDCGFDRFDDPASPPSRCPECKSERLADPTFVIE